MINDNAYKVDLFGGYGANVIFNIVDLTLFNIGFDLNQIIFKGIKDDVGQPMNTKDQLHALNGPIIR